MEFLVEFEIDIPQGAPETEIGDRERAEAVAAAELARGGHIERVWNTPIADGHSRVLGLYRAENRAELDGLLNGLPMREWMTVTVTALEPHRNDPAVGIVPHEAGAWKRELPAPRLTMVYRLMASVGEPLDLGETAAGRRRVVPLMGGRFEGPKLSGRLVPGASADWQIVQADGTALADLRYTLETDQGSLLYVQGRGVRHGTAAVLARLGRGEHVDASEYTFRTTTRIETGDAELNWLNKGVFVSVGGRQPGGVTYETYLVG